MKLRGLKFASAQRRSGANVGTTEYAVSPFGRNEWSSASGVVIDGVFYTLQGEPPIAKGGNWFTGHVSQ